MDIPWHDHQLATVLGNDVRVALLYVGLRVEFLLEHLQLLKGCHRAPNQDQTLTLVQQLLIGANMWIKTYVSLHRADSLMRVVGSVVPLST